MVEEARLAAGTSAIYRSGSHNSYESDRDNRDNRDNRDTTGSKDAGEVDIHVYDLFNFDADEAGSERDDDETTSERDESSYQSEINSWDEDYTTNNPFGILAKSGQEARKSALQTADTWAHFRHLTISQDQTHAGASGREKLAALQEKPRFSTRKHTKKLKKTTRTAETGTPPLREISGRRRFSSVSDYSYSDETSPSSKSGIVKGTGNPMNTAAMLTMNSKKKKDKVSNAMQIAQLEEQIQELRRQQNSFKSTTWLILHKTDGESSCYFVEPSWAWEHRSASFRLVRNSPVADLDGYLHERLDVAFVVYKHYDHGHQAKAVERAKAEERMLPEPVPVKETIQLLYEQMIAAVDAFVSAQPTFKVFFPGWNSTSTLESPFMF
jgi:hypothetical protein